MINEKKCELVINKFFEALKNAKPDYEIEGTGLTYHATLELIRVTVNDSIKGNEDQFESLVSSIMVTKFERAKTCSQNDSNTGFDLSYG